MGAAGRVPLSARADGVAGATGDVWRPRRAPLGPKVRRRRPTDWIAWSLDIGRTELDGSMRVQGQRSGL